MSKERLGEIKRAYGYKLDVNTYPHWLISRVQELEKENNEIHEKDFNLVVRLQKQNKRYREAMERIKDNIPLEFIHNSELEARKNEIRLMNISNEIDEALEGDPHE